MNRFNYYNSDLDAFELYHLQSEELLSSPSSATPQEQRIQPPDEYNAIIAGLSGAVGTSISNIAVYPIDLIVKRLQVQRAIRSSSSSSSSNNEKSNTGDDNDELYKDFVDAAKRIYKEEGGLRAFYSGCLQDTANSMGSAFIYFLSYNFMRQRRLHANTPPSGKPPKTLGVLEELSIGVLSGAIAKFFTAPIANIVTRKQTAALQQRNTKAPQNRSTDANAIVKDIYKEKGIRGFWSGYDATLILTLNPAITFFLYESLKSLLPRKYREKPTGAQTFLLAAISKAVASSIMYPISMAKARSQVQKNKDKTGGGKFAVLEALKDAYKSGGVAGMYEGVWGEILKGFFSNGITMLIKEALHRQILSMYVFIIRLRRKNKTLTDVLADATRDAYQKNTTPEQREAFRDLAATSQQKIDSAGSAVKSSTASVAGATQDTLSTARDRVKDIVESGMDKTSQLTADARKNITQLLDPETLHVGDVSREVGEIELADSAPGQNGDVKRKTRLARSEKK